MPSPPTSRARANVLGVGVDAIDMPTAVSLIDSAVASCHKGYVCITGVHGIMEAQRNEHLKTILNNSYLTTPDGMPTVWIGKLQGFRHMDRVYGPDLMLQVCRLSVSKAYTHFLYGSKPGVAEQLKSVLTRRFPGIRILAAHCPPFRPLNNAEERDLIERVGDLKPDLFWVGLSTPKQERFMAEFMEKLDTKMMLGVGAAFDIHAGLLNDSPAWAKRAGLQWLHRLCQEPKRLWKRYLVNNPEFMLRASLQLTRIHKYTIPERADDSNLISGPA
jgi:N-acetylglucosaminyldiphosphoundecaprenol N-acetyl-beta-D-mannosaminyltransferase